MRNAKTLKNRECIIKREKQLSLLFRSHFYSFKVRLHRNARRFLSQISGRVLDIGAGSKPYRCYLKKDVTYISMDLNNSYHPDVVGSTLQLGFLPGAFDAVICTEVLEHVPDPYRALFEINNVLKQGGIFI
jgi:SAM-dependent methyltransferase